MMLRIPVLQLCFAILWTPFFSTSLPAQTTTTTSATITSSSELVLVPTIVHDKSGAHIAGLTKDDFVLKQDGKIKSVAIFEEVKTNSSVIHRSRGEHGVFTNFEPLGASYRRISIIVLDFVNTPFGDQATARQELLKFLLAAADSGEPICLLALTPRGLSVIHDFADDPKLLANALRGVKPAPSLLVNNPEVEASHPPPGDGLGEMLTRLIRDQLQSEASLTSLETKDRVLITIEALQQIAKAFKAFPGRKALIWASSGFPFSLSSSSMLLCDPACPTHQRSEIQGAYDNLWRLMNDSQIAIYAVDLRSATADSLISTGGVRPSDIGDPQFDTDSLAQERKADTDSSLQLFSANTGGKAFLGGSNLARSFRQALEDDSNYYMLGFYVSRRDTKPGWHDISVTARAKGAQIRFRNGFFIAQDVTPPSARQEIRSALNSGLDYTGVPISMTWSNREPANVAGKTKVTFELVMPAGFASVDVSDQNHMIVDIAAVARNPKGEVVGDVSQRIDVHLKSDGLEQIQHNGMTYRNALQLPPGEYNVRFVVRDSIGDHTGSLAAPLAIDR